MVFTNSKAPIVIDGLAKAMSGLNTSQLAAFISTNKLNVAQASLALRAAGLTREQRIQILQQAGLITSNASLTVSLKSVIAALWAQTKAWAASPLGMATIAAASIFLIVKAVDWMTVSLEESREALANLKEEYTDNENELTTLNDELQTTIDRINELQGKDSLTFTEAEELTNLKKQNAELERQIALLETVQKQKMLDIHKTFIDVMEKDVNNVDDKKFSSSGAYTTTKYDKLVSENYEPTDHKYWRKENGGHITRISEKEYIKAVMMRREEVVNSLSGKLTDKERESLSSLLKEIDDYLTDKSQEFADAADGISYVSNPTTSDEKAVNEWLDFINDFNDQMMILLGTNGAKENAIQRLINNGFADATAKLKELGEQGLVTSEYLSNAKYDKFVSKCIELGIVSDKSESSLAFLALAFNNLKESAGEAGGAVAGSSKSFKSVLSDVKTLDSGLSELGKIYKDISDRGDFEWDSILDNDDFANAFGSLGDEYDALIRTVSSSPKNISACQDAFNDLATKYVLNSDALKGVTEETRTATIAMLEQMGVANAASIVDAQLSYNKERLTYTTGKYVDMEYEEILALYNSCAAGSAAKQVLAELAMSKMAANGQRITTTTDIEQLIALANAANATTDTLHRLTQAKLLFSKAEAAEANGNTARAEVYAAKADELLNQKFEYNTVDPSKFGVKFDGGASVNGGAGGSDSPEKDSWFQTQLEEHKHLVAMEQETEAEYLAWLSDAYPKAYEEGIIELEGFYQYQQEVFQGLRDVFMDNLSDVEHEISMRSNYDGESAKIIQLYEQLIKDVEKEIASAKAKGLTDEDDYIQELQNKWQDYTVAIKDIRDEVTDSAKSALDELVDYRINMLKKEIEDEKDILDEKLDNLKEFYDKQKEMLQDQRDEENYLKEQSDKRKSVTDLQAELAMLEHDDSAWAQKRKLELKEELATAQEDLDEFEKDHALDLTLDALDKAYNDQEAQIQTEMDALEERLNDPEALYNKALEDIRKNSENQLYYQMLMYNRQFGDGNDETVNELWESAFGALNDYEKLFGELYKGIDLKNETDVKDNGGWDDEAVSGPNQNNQPPASNTPEPPPAEKSYPYGKASETSGDITVGATGDKVKAIQHALNELGYGNSGTANCDGNFGNGTKQAVKAFQSAMGISADGIVGKNTRAKFKAQGYAVGTSNATPGIHAVDELGTEYIFESPSDGTRYRMFHGGEKVLTADATDFLYQFANSGGSILTKMISDLFRLSSFGNISKPTQTIEVNAGNIIIQGSASEHTVSEIRRAQRSNLEFILKSLNSLNK